MSLMSLESLPTSSLKALLVHLGEIDDPREPWRLAHSLSEVLLLVVCTTSCDCDHSDAIAAWGKSRFALLRRHLFFDHGVPGGRWLTLLMNRIDPGLFAQLFTDRVRGTRPERPDPVAIDGKTSRRSYDRATGTPPLHLISAFATKARLVLGQQAVPPPATPFSFAEQSLLQAPPDKASETTAIPVLIDRLADRDGLKGLSCRSTPSPPPPPSPPRSARPPPRWLASALTLLARTAGDGGSIQRVNIAVQRQEAAVETPGPAHSEEAAVP